MKPTEITKSHVIARYVTPARLRGEEVIGVRVGNVQKELGWTNRTPSVYSTLSSKEFQQEAGVQLIEKRGGPASGGPSTTVEFVYKITVSGAVHGEEAAGELTAAGAPKLLGLMAAYGVLKGAYEAYGGGDAFLRAERAAWGPDPWEKHDLEQVQSAGSDK